MKRLVAILLALLGALGLLAGIFGLEGVSASLQHLLVVVLMLYLTALLDWYTFCRPAYQAPRNLKRAIGIFSGCILFFSWLLLIWIVWGQSWR